jgi:uncharacterized protein (TIGR02246 family)
VREARARLRQGLTAALADGTRRARSDEEVVMNATEQELVELEKKYWQALKEEDVETCLELTHDPCIVTGSMGVMSLDKKAFREMMSKEQTYKINDYDLKDVNVRLLSDDVAIVAYKVHEDLTVDGKPVSLDAADGSTWIKRNGKWVCALHTESIAGDPFGRDRKPSA